MERIQFIDRLKGLAIILVVIGHLGLSQVNEGIVKFIYTFHMPLFMFLSGIVIATPPHLIKVIKKWQRFIVPFFVVGLLSVIYRDLSLQDFVYSSSKGGYWYLLVLALFYVFLLPFRLANKIIKEVVFDISYAVFIYLCLISIVKIFRISWDYDILSIHRCIEMWPFFILGYFTRKYNLLDYIMRYSIIYSLSLIAVIVGFYLLVVNKIDSWQINEMLGIPIIVILIYVFSKYEKSQTLIANQLSYIGRCSLEVYIFHYFIIKSINLSPLLLWSEKTNNGLIAYSIITIVSLLVVYISIGIGWIFHQEKWMQKLIYGNF